ncbi:HAD-IC family P-type ATPase [Rhodococcus sp. NPDC058521]|uniref:cation-translocating P-type ATPase n=1 Tax=Rhodococcus sp. NPDC058521 TaxID=3346536 RepID=UPI003665FA99
MTRAPVGLARAVAPAVVSELIEHAAGDLSALLDPRTVRNQRRVTNRPGHVFAEVRGLATSEGADLARDLAEQLRRTDGVTWFNINAATGRVAVEHSSLLDVDAVLKVLEEVEEAGGVATEPWSRRDDHPADREPLFAGVAQLTTDAVGAIFSLTTTAVPSIPVMRTFQAAAALMDVQPRLRRGLEGRLGNARADLTVTVANGLGHAIGGSPSSLLIDACQRAVRLAENTSRYELWRAWEQHPNYRRQTHVEQPTQASGRPVPLPRGPIESFADSAAVGSGVASIAALLSNRGLHDAASAALIGVPTATRASRECFAGSLSTMMARHGVLSMKPQAWRHLDRLTAVVVDQHALCSSRRLVLDAENLDAEWNKEHVWRAAQRLLWTARHGKEEGHPATLPIPPPPGRQRNRLQLLESRRRTDRQLDTAWYELRDNDHPVGRVLVGPELDSHAGSLLAEARRAGLRVIVIGDASGNELRPITDEFVTNHGSTTEVVQRLQQDGYVVGLVSRDAHKAMAAADLSIGLFTDGQHTQVVVPWNADLICPDLQCAERILAATPVARQVSRRGRVLAFSASTIGGLLMVAGQGKARRSRVTSPLVIAQLAGMCFSIYDGVRAGLGWSPDEVPLVPWHGLEPDEVLARLPDPDRKSDATTAASPPAALSAVSTAIGKADKFSGPLGAGLRSTVVGSVNFAGQVRRELQDPITPLLGVGATASAILGSPTDAILVGSVLGLDAIVSALQHRRADQALEEMLITERQSARLLIHPAARDRGYELRETDEEAVPADELRPGDVIAVRGGDIVPADARLLAVDGLETDESGLTGESVTVDKQTGATPGAQLSDRACMVFEGSVVVNGTGRAVVVAVGAGTQSGRALAVSGPPPRSGVQNQLHELTDRTLPVTLAGGGLVTALSFLRGRQLRPALADGIAVAVAAVPEGLPLVATVAQLAAARRLLHKGVLVRSSRTVEALGRVDTMCFDKTGTLTEGRLDLVALADADDEWDTEQSENSKDARRLLRAAARACPDPDEGPVSHATDRAVIEGAQRHLGKQSPHRWDPIEEIPFESNRGYAATLGHTSKHTRLCVKGAPEVLLPRCTRGLRGKREGTAEATRSVVDMTMADRRKTDTVVERLAKRGLRVLVVARRDFTNAPDELEDSVEELTLLGFIGLADTPRPETLPLITELTHNDLSVRMITGDHPVTARAIAEQLGISAEEVTTGKDLDELDESGQAALIDRSSVFARVSPEHKVRIVTALRHAGHTVAMTGDGSNDAAAIRTADVGIGIAAQGSAAARNAADLVLTESDTTLLLDALVEGRGMWQRVRDAVGVLVGGNAGEVAFTLIGTTVIGRAPVGTRQYLLVNLFTDMFPAMAVALSKRTPTNGDTPVAEAPDIRSRAAVASAELAALPRPELGAEMMRIIAVRGATTAAGATAAWTIGRFTGPRMRASTMGLAALVGTQLGQTLVTAWHSPLVWATTSASAAALAVIIMTPGVGSFFGCVPLDPFAWFVVASSSAAATAMAAILPARSTSEGQTPVRKEIHT